MFYWLEVVELSVATWCVAVHLSEALLIWLVVDFEVECFIVGVYRVFACEAVQVAAVGRIVSDCT